MAPVKTPLVSVIVPVYNGERYLRAALDSAIAQTYNHTEVIVVDDGSTDRSPAILNEYGHRIRVLSQQNAGQAAARNRGAETCNGDWIAFLDQDDLWDPDKVKTQLQLADVDADVIHSNARAVDAQERVLQTSLRRSPLQGNLRLLDLIRSNHILTLTAMVRRQAFEQVGGFDPANRYGTEDYQLWLRLAAKGFRFSYIDAVLASSRKHSSNMSRDRSKQASGRIYALKKTRHQYAQAFGKAERRAYHSGLHQNNFDIAWHSYDTGDYGLASRHFWRAVWHRPADLQAWAHAAVTSLPLRSRLVPRIRAIVTKDK